MKTINSDLGAFLKRLTASNANTPASMTLLHDGKVFIVKCGDDSTRSQYLDDALENLSEAMRRRANQMAPIRETKPEPAKNKPMPNLSFSVSVPVNPAPPPQINAVVPSCPQCGSLPHAMSASSLGVGFACKAAHGWMLSTPPYGHRVVMDNGDTHVWDGNRYLTVTP